MKENDENLLLKESEAPVFITEESQQEDLFKSNTKAHAYEVFEKNEKIKNRDYKVGEKKDVDRKDSPKMLAIIDQVDFLENLIDSLTFDTSSEEAIESFKASSETLMNRMKIVVERCADDLNAKNPWSAFGKARYRIVNEMAERLDRDIVGLQQKTDAYLALPEEEKRRFRSWTDILNWERSFEYKDQTDGVKISHTGGNTSDITLIEKDGKKMFFKPEGKLYVNNLGLLLDQKENEYHERVNKNNDINPEVDRPELYVDDFIKAIRHDFISAMGMQKAFNDAFYEIPTTMDGFLDLKNLCKKLSLNGVFRTVAFIDHVEGLTDENLKKGIKKEVGLFFAEFRRDRITSEVAGGTANISVGDNIAKRNVATSRLAKLLNISNLVPQSEMTTVETDGKKKYGVVMDEVKGIPTLDIIEGKVSDELMGKRVVYSAEAVRDLFDLQVFDAICGQIDRHEGNRMIMLEKSQTAGDSIYVAKKAGGIDSDMSFGKINYSEFRTRSKGDLKKFEDKNGIAIPGMSRELAESILALSPEILDYEMLGLLNKKERQALTDRLIGVQEAIKRQMEYEKKHQDVPSKFIEKNKWESFKESLKKKVLDSKSFRVNLHHNSYVNPAMLFGRITK